MHLSQFLSRFCGPLLFSAAFLAYVANFNTFAELTNTVRSKFTENEVYYQSSVDADDQIFDFDRKAKDPTFTVSGEYVMSLLCNDIETKVAIINTKNDVYQKIVINPNMANGEASFTTYKSKLNAHGGNSLEPVLSAIWTVDSEFPLHNFVDVTANYKIITNYNADGTLNSITAEKV